MLLLAKCVLGLGATVVMSTAYVFHEGVIRVDVDEARRDGAHVHFWVPATAVSAGLYVVPRHHLRLAVEQARPYLPALREFAKELQNYPNAKFVDVTDHHDHVTVSTVNGKILIDVVNDEETVHVRVPIETLRDVSDHLEADAPGI